MTPEPTPAGTLNGWLNCEYCICWLVICTTAGLTRDATSRTAVLKSPVLWSLGADAAAGAAEGASGVWPACAGLPAAAPLFPSAWERRAGVGVGVGLGDAPTVKPQPA